LDINDVKTLYSSYLFQNYGREDICLSHGDREFLYDINGKRYVDFVAGIAVNCLGHAHPALVEAITKQAKRMLHVSNLYYTMEQADLGEAVASIVPSPLAVSMFCNSGAEANEAALKLAAKHTKRTKFVACLNSFHGRTAGALAATGQRKYQEGYECLLSNAFDFVNFNDSEAMKAMVSQDTAAVVMEMVQGEGGVIPASPEFVRTVRDLCDDTGTLMIVDEVQTGMGRTGTLFAHEQFGITPDLMTLAKALGNGLPIGALLATEEAAGAFSPGAHAATFGGNHLVTAVAQKVLAILSAPEFLARVRQVGAYFRDRLQSLVDEFARVREARGLGLLLGLALDVPGKPVVEACLTRGFLINCTQDTILRFAPPLIVTENEIDQLVAALQGIFREMGL
jgi:acetylornithine/N-succinyldiaminopimelate aminotransferase